MLRETVLTHPEAATTSGQPGDGESEVRKDGLRSGHPETIVKRVGTHFSNDLSLKWFTDRLAVDPATDSQAGKQM